MEVWIKYIGEESENYTRYGKTISKSEKKIDVYKFFGISFDNKNRAMDIVKSLESDKNLFVKRHKGG